MNPSKKKNTIRRIEPTGMVQPMPTLNQHVIHSMLNALDRVAIIATNAKFHVTFANRFALDIFSLTEQTLGSSKAKLPRSIQQRIQTELQLGQHEYTLQYAISHSVRTLRVTCFTLKDASLEDDSMYVFHMHDMTEQIHTEIKLRHTEKLLRNLIDATPDLIYFKDGKNRWQEANQSGLSLLRLNSEEYQNKSDTELSSLLHPIFKDSFRRLSAADRYAWESQKMVREEETIQLPQGGSRVYDIIKIPMFQEDGQRQGLVTLGRDITERKQAELQLKERSAVLDALIASDWLLHSSESWRHVAADVLKKLAHGTRFCRANMLKVIKTGEDKQTALETVFSWQDTDRRSFGEPIQTLNFERDGCARWLASLQEGHLIFGDIDEFPSAEHKYLKTHGTQSIVIIPIFTNETWWGALMFERLHVQQLITSQELGVLMSIGRSFGVAISRENAGKRLHQAQIAFDSATEGIMIIDENTNIIAINKGFTEITGYSEEEVLGCTPLAFQYAKHDMWNTLLAEGRWRGEISNFRRNGEPYQEWLTLTIVRNDEGRIINYVGVFADITEVKLSQTRLHELVNHDPLTGLPNRRLLNELIDQSIKRAGRENRQVALLFIDLDRFKAVNDTLGHQVGDKLLYDASKRISRTVRESDVVSRLGGDEFLVVMDMLGEPEDASKVAQKLIQALQAEFNIEGREIFISASIGISLYPQDGNDVDSLIKAADIAMYQVKNRGKNNHCFYSADLSINAVEKFTLENQLRKALERNQFEVYYQPQVSLVTGKFIGAEALIRWNHPDMGLVSPAKFIPVAEETGLIIPIGEWVLRQAAMKAMEWVNEYSSFEWIAVNVSGVQIMRSNFADTVYGVLIETDCDPRMLELEITESTVMQNTEYVINTFDRIKKLGVRLAIDDFGTGYSSLSNLKRLPLDKLKIDQSFVRDLPEDTDDAAIANAINAMAKSLGFCVIAEGVETDEQVTFLKAMGCEEGQGYLFSRPVSATAFKKLLVENCG